MSRVAAPDSLVGIDENAVGRIDTRETNIVAQYLVGREPRALVAGAGSLWVADTRDQTVSRLDADDNRVVTIPVGSDPVAVAFGDGAPRSAERRGGEECRLQCRARRCPTS